MINLESVVFELCCPVCKTALKGSFDSCAACGQKFSVDQKDWIDLCVTKNNINDHTEAAYKVYSKYYAPVALLVYLLVWRGNFVRHVKFFRELLTKSLKVVDLATGDGSLTRLALFGSRKKRAANLLGIDISGNMLRKAKKKLPAAQSTLLRADVMQLPFADGSVSGLSCFGGLNSFPNGGHALRECARVLARDGVMRGSVLLTPTSSWRRNLVLGWIEKGYQTDTLDLQKFEAWVNDAKLQIALSERHGDAYLFELRHRSE